MLQVIDVAMKALRLMLGDDASLRLVGVSELGTSGAHVFLIRRMDSAQTYAVKCVRGGRITLAEEISHHQIIQPFFGDHLPNVLWLGQIDGHEVMVSECRGGHTLHSMIMHSLLPQNRLRAIWEEIVTHLTKVWGVTRHSPFMMELCPRYHPARCQRVKDGVLELTLSGVEIRNCLSLPLVINGKEYPSITEAFAEIEAVGRPQFGVTCHGDPQPSNVVVEMTGFWSLVDWEWSGRHHDWRTMVSHLYGWWPMRYAVLLDEPNVVVRSGKLHIDYQFVLPAHIASYQEAARRAYLSMCEDVGMDPEDVFDINRYLATLYFGETRFLQLQSRGCYGAPMLAEAVKTASAVLRKRIDSANSFTFNPQKGGAECTGSS